MADEGIKKSKILPKDFPAMTLDGKYIVRYRIVTEDKKQFSAWSPKFTLTSPSMSSLLSSTQIGYNVTPSLNKENNNIMTLDWNVPSNIPLPNEYDVYTKWGKASSISISTVSSSGTTLTINTSTAHGLSNNQKVTIFGVSVSAVFNGTFSITVVDSDTFTVTSATSQTISSTAETSALVYPFLNFYITYKQRTLGYLVTVTTSAVHGLSAGNDIIITGLGNGYSGAYTIVSVPTTTTFTYISFGDNLASTAVTSNTAYVQSISYANDEYGNWTTESKIKTTNSTIFTALVPNEYTPVTGITNVRFAKFLVQVATTKKLPTSTIAKLFESSPTATDVVVGGTTL